MNSASTVIVWLQLIGLLAGEVALVVGGSVLVERFTRSAAWRRTLWQVCLLSLLLLPLGELSGTARMWADWLVRNSVRQRSDASFRGGREVAFRSTDESRANVAYRAAGTGQLDKAGPAGTRRETSQPQAVSSRAIDAAPIGHTPEGDLFSAATGVQSTAEPRIASGGVSARLHTTGPLSQPESGRQDAALNGSQDGRRRDSNPAQNAYAGLPIEPVAVKEDAVTDSMAVLCLALVWLGGTVLVIARIGLAWLLLWLFRRHREVVANLDLHGRVEALARALGVGLRVRLMESPGLTGPIVFGLWRPVIGLPTDFAERFSAPQQEAMLAHELAHLAARDPFWYLLANWTSAVLWWHPLVWWARRQLHCASEQAADEASLVVADGPGALAECLVMLGTRLGQRRSFVWMGVEGSGPSSGLGRRVERLIHLRGSTHEPPGRAGTALARIFGPAALVVGVILCTAWIGPRAFTKGESMKTIKQTWSHSLAAFSLLTALGSDNTAASARSGSGPGRSAEPLVTKVYQLKYVDPTRCIAMMRPTIAQSGRVVTAGTTGALVVRATEKELLEVDSLISKLDIKPVAHAADPAGGNKAAPAETTATNDAENRPPPAPQPTPGAKESEAQNARDYQRIMMERYGMIPRSGPLPDNKATISQERSPIAAKLERIVIDEVTFEGVPLPEVLKWLDEESRKRDREKQGINFLINPNAPVARALQTIDPTTGQPIPLPPPEPPDMNSVIVRFNLPLREVRLKDVLDAMVKVADKPIEYSVEDYGVVFSASPSASAGGSNASAPRLLDSQPLIVRTFKVDTNTFLAGLKRAFGTEFDPKENDRPDQIRSALRDVFSRLGINMEVPGKTVFYNDLTGIVMVRATYEDLEIVKAAIETLGGSASDQVAAQNPPKERADFLDHREEMMRRYGIVPPTK